MMKNEGGALIMALMKYFDFIPVSSEYTSHCQLFQIAVFLIT